MNGNNVQDLTLFTVEKHNGDKCIHMHGYGYRSQGYNMDESQQDKPYRFVEYNSFIVPIKKVIEEGFTSVESMYSELCKQSIVELDEKELLEYYGVSNRKPAPKLVTQHGINENMKYGTYIFVPEVRMQL